MTINSDVIHSVVYYVIRWYLIYFQGCFIVICYRVLLIKMPLVHLFICSFVQWEGNCQIIPGILKTIEQYRLDQNIASYNIMLELL